MSNTIISNINLLYYFLGILVALYLTIVQIRSYSMELNTKRFNLEYFSFLVEALKLAALLIFAEFCTSKFIYTLIK